MLFTHISADTFEYERILAPIREFPIGRFYYCSQEPQGVAWFQARPEILQTLKKFLDDENIILVNCGLDFISIYKKLETIIKREIQEGNKVFLNLSGGTKIFTSAATLVSTRYEVEMYYAVPKSYYIEKPGYTRGVEKIITLPPLAEKPKIIPYLSKLCFVAMPFNDELLAIYEDAIKPIVEGESLQCVRSDDFFEPKSIMEDIWDAIQKSRVVIADLTTRNANVFYEVGIAHALGRAVILLSQSLDDVPSDLRHIRCIIYKDTYRGLEKLKTNLKKSIKSVLNKTEKK